MALLQYYQGYPEFKRRRAAIWDRALQLLHACEPLVRCSLPTRTAQDPALGLLAASSAATSLSGAGVKQAVANSAVASAYGDDEDEQDASAQALAVSLLDDVLERADCALDAAAQQRTAATALPQARGGVVCSPCPFVARASGLQRYNARLARPQDSFPEPVDNSNREFVPRAHGVSRAPAAAPVGSARASSGYVHPFAPELESLVYEPWQLEAPEPQEAGALDETPCTWVDTPQALHAMVQALRGQRHIAVDLEHHSYRWA